VPWWGTNLRKGKTYRSEKTNTWESCWGKETSKETIVVSKKLVNEGNCRASVHYRLQERKLNPKVLRGKRLGFDLCSLYFVHFQDGEDLKGETKRGGRDETEKAVLVYTNKEQVTRQTSGRNGDEDSREGFLRGKICVKKQDKAERVTDMDWAVTSNEGPQESWNVTVSRQQGKTTEKDSKTVEE